MFSDILYFIVNHLEIIISSILVIISLVLQLIKKKPQLNEIDNILIRVLIRLPQWIQSAEFLEGADVKKTMVLNAVKKYVKDEFSLILPQSSLDFISARIEDILSTPQKH